MRIEQSGKGRELPEPGRRRRLPQKLPFLPQTYTPIVCPYCHVEKPRVKKTTTITRYYKCLSCGVPFKIRVTPRG